MPEPVRPSRKRPPKNKKRRKRSPSPAPESDDNSGGDDDAGDADATPRQRILEVEDDLDDATVSGQYFAISTC